MEAPYRRKRITSAALPSGADPILITGAWPDATSWYIVVRDTPSSRAASATRSRSGASGVAGEARA
jgi:hypothetical protein